MQTLVAFQRASALLMMAEVFNSCGPSYFKA